MARRLLVKCKQTVFHTTFDSGNLTLSGRSLMFVRNVGHLMTNDATYLMTSRSWGIMDGMITSLIGMHDLRGNSVQNSRKRYLYCKTQDAWSESRICE